jgi:hypothetical protein
MVGSCKQGNKPVGYIKNRKLPVQLNDYKLLKNDSAPSSLENYLEFPMYMRYHHVLQHA